ncbi:MAG: hypothetical protein WBG71_07875 [Leeuwenhoekiella sp.]
MSKGFIITVLLGVLTIGTVQAQYYGNGGGRGFGRNRSIAPATPQAAPEPPTPQEIVADRLPEYQKTFELDNFQAEVLRVFMEEHLIGIMSLQKDKTLNAEGMRKKYERLQKEFKENLKSIMTEAEVEKLITMDFSQSAQRKRDKKRKKGDDDN